MENKELDLNSILKNSKAEIQTFFNNKDQIADAYEFERQIVDLSRKMTLELLQQAVGKVPRSKNQKKKFGLVMEILR